MSLVLDCSATLSWFFEDEESEAGTHLLDRVGREGAIVPALWPLEVANGFQMAVKRRRITKSYRDDCLVRLSKMEIAIDSETSSLAWGPTLNMADDFQLTAYDAAYLELARRKYLPLATLDKALISAAATLGIQTIGS